MKRILLSVVLGITALGGWVLPQTASADWSNGHHHGHHHYEGRHHHHYSRYRPKPYHYDHYWHGDHWDVYKHRGYHHHDHHRGPDYYFGGYRGGISTPGFSIRW